MSQEVLAILGAILPELASWVEAQFQNGLVETEIRETVQALAAWFALVRASGKSPAEELRAMIAAADSVADAAERAKFGSRS